MSQIALGSISSNNHSLSLLPQPKIESQEMKQIEDQLKSKGTQEIGEQAFRKALSQISKMLEGRNVQISSTFEANTGMEQVTITDGVTGKKIAQLPPDAVVAMAEKAKDKQFGLLLDKNA